VLRKDYTTDSYLNWSIIRRFLLGLEKGQKT
jgi:hypothetical protein